MGLFHLCGKMEVLEVMLYLGLSVIGAVVGHLIAQDSGFSFLTIGTMHLGGAILGSIVFLFVGHWLSLVEIKPKKHT